MANLIIRASLDHAALDRGIVSANAKIGQFSKNIQSAGGQLELQFKRAAQRLIAYGGIFATVGLAKQIIEIRGQFQQLSIAFETMLDSKDKSDRIMAQSITLAQKTPYTLMEVTTNAKQLMAMGVAYKDVMSTLKNLGDVAAGVSVPLSRIAINYGQVMTLGKLQQREIRDFAMAGVPLVAELSKNLGKTKDEIYAMVSAGNISAADVTKAFQTMANEGGKFYNLMEKQNKSVTGQISNITDKWQVMLNEIGTANEGFIYGGIKMTASLIANYKEIGSILIDLITLYGEYRAALMVTTAAQKLITNLKHIEEARGLNLLLSAEKQSIITKSKLTVGTIAYANAVNVEIIAEGKLLAETVASTTKELALAELELAARKQIFLQRERDLKLAESELVVDGVKLKGKKEIVASEKIQAASIATKTAAAEVDIAVSKVDLLATEKKIAATAKATFANKVNSASKVANFTVTGFLTAANKALTASLIKLRAVMVSHPYVMLALAITAVAFGVYKLINADTALEKAEKKLQETQKKTREENEKNITESTTLAEKIRNTTTATYESIKAYDELIKRFEFFRKFSQEDIRKMTQEQWSSVLDEFSLFTDKTSAQKNYDNQLKIVKDLKDMQSQYNPQNPQNNGIANKLSPITPAESYTNYINKQIPIETEILNKYQDVLDKIKKQEKEAEIAKLDVTGKNEYYNSIIAELKARKATLNLMLGGEDGKEGINGEAGKSKNREIDLGFNINKNAILKSIKDINDEIAKEESKLIDIRNEDNIKKNKQYWEKKRDDAYAIYSNMEKTDPEFKKQKDIYLNAVSNLEAWDAKGEDKKISERQKKQQQAAEKLADNISNYELSREIKKNNAILDIEKQTKQQKLDDAKNIYDTSMIAAKKQADENLQLWIESGSENQELGQKFIEQYVSSIEDADAIFAASTGKINKEAADGIKEIMAASTEAFLSNTEKEKKAINDKYDQWIDDAKKKGALEEDLSLLEERRTEEISTIYADKAYKLSEFYQKAFGDISRYSYESLADLSTKAQNLIDTATKEDIAGKTYFIVDIPTLDKEGKEISKVSKMTAEEFLALKNKVNEFNNELNKKNPFVELSAAFKKLKNAIKSGDSEQIADAITGLTKPLESSLDMIIDWAGSIGDIFNTLTDATTDSISSMISSVASLGVGIAKVSTGNLGGIANILSGTSGILGTIITSQKEYAKSVKEFAIQLMNLKKEINSIIFEELLNFNNNNIFVTDNLKTIENAYIALKQAQENFNKYRIIDNPFNNVLSDSSLFEYLSKLKIKIGETSDTFLTIKLGARNVYGSLLEQYPNLINENGSFNASLAKTLLSLEDIPDVTKLGLEALIEYTEEIEKAEEVINDAIKSIVGEIGSDLYNALRNAWDAGTDSFLAFKETISEGLEDIISQILFNAVFSDSLLNLQENIKESLTTGDKNIMDDIEAFFKSAPDLITAWKEGMEAASESAKKAGLEWGVDSTTSTLAGQIQKDITEETGTELAGLARSSRDDMRTVRDLTRVGIKHLSLIEINTANTVSEIKKSNEKLDRVIKNTTPQYSAGL